MYENLNFDSLDPIEIPVRIAGKDYVLREASEDAACKYRNALLRSTKMSEGKVSGIDGMADAAPLLVSCCLFEAAEGGRRLERPVPLPVVRGWQARVVKPLFETLKSISDLDEKDTAEALDKRIAELTEKREALRVNGEPAKNLPAATALISGSA